MRLDTDPTCLFCKIIVGEIPSFKIAETTRAYAFLDIGPLSQGHSLVIPKQHGLTIDHIDDEHLAECITLMRDVGSAVQDVTGVDGWNVLQNNGEVAGQVVGHVHFHIIPRKNGDGLGYRWNVGEFNHDEASELSSMIASCIKRQQGK